MSLFNDPKFPPPLGYVKIDADLGSEECYKQGEIKAGEDKAALRQIPDEVKDLYKLKYQVIAHARDVDSEAAALMSTSERFVGDIRELGSTAEKAGKVVLKRLFRGSLEKERSNGSFLEYKRAWGPMNPKSCVIPKDPRVTYYNQLKEECGLPQKECSPGELVAYTKEQIELAEFQLAILAVSQLSIKGANELLKFARAEVKFIDLGLREFIGHFEAGADQADRVARVTVRSPFSMSLERAYWTNARVIKNAEASARSWAYVVSEAERLGLKLPLSFLRAGSIYELEESGGTYYLKQTAPNGTTFTIDLRRR